MSIVSPIVGPVFYDLLQHGRELDRAIARRDASLLNHSTPGLERYFSRPPGELPRQNPFPVAALFPLFLVAFAFNLLPFLQTLPPFSAPIRVASFFVPALVIIFFLLTSGVLLARGYTLGLKGFLALFLILSASTVVQALRAMVSAGESLWPLAFAALALLCCRLIFNRQGFVLFAIYCRSQRLALLAGTLRRQRK
ncbi:MULTISPECIES: hypothetical protein [Klebsiella]|uniref:hypothetical protein n=1 Tax=Klebsiella TaxID=570 RepID=UPI0005EE2171|nr:MULTISPECIES: hypothetical protein [Klebsiella]EKU8179443.1 hypothetical protein [Klebsiella aerogenes]ELA1937568.1 hypothetical protein [Klebsiella aerogenes]ELA2016174.1 hypothetical protein [Klebsiella aerogenes]KJO38702.1 hypothetical protein SR85_24390 [Klebsiella aerogenes]KJO43198.1 hypothetical protein SR83_12285 [Klebsiella aerogenes]